MHVLSNTYGILYTLSEVLNEVPTFMHRTEGLLFAFVPKPKAVARHITIPFQLKAASKLQGELVRLFWGR